MRGWNLLAKFQLPPFNKDGFESLSHFIKSEHLMKLSFFKVGLRIAIFQLGLLLCQNLSAAVTFTNTPSAVSNTYSGTITLQVTGLTSGDNVVVQDYLDANTNGVIDAGDYLVQQFNLTDGQASVFHNGSTAVTNFNVPGDTDGAANGSITAQLGFSQLGGVVIIGKYALKLSSPSGHFTPITNFFSITNFPYAGSFTGSVVSNGTSTTLPNAVVLLSQPSNGGGQNVGSGVVANNSGVYTIKAPPGNYSLFAFKSNFVANLGTAPSLALSSGTITTNLSLIPATRSISGKIIDASTSAGLPGISGAVSSTDNFLAISFTDTNGNFNVPVTASQWKFEGSGPAAYLKSQNNQTADTTTGSVSGVTNALTKATAIFYGSVKDRNNNPLVGVNMYSSDNDGGNNQYEQDSVTDANTNYNYVAGASGGDTWYVQVDGDQSPSLANYIFSQSTLQNGSINLTNGQAVRQDFTAILATNYITGHVQDSHGNNISGVGVNANTTTSINGVNYSAHTDTDDNGNYTLNVANGDWSISLNCGTGDDSLGNILGGNYQCPCDENVTISNNNVTTNFTVLPGGSGQIFGYVTNSAGTPIVGVIVSATDCNGDYDGTYTDGNGYYSFNNVANYIYDVSVNCGDLSNQGYQCVSDQNVTVSSDNIEQDFTPQFSSSGPLQITTASLPNGTNTTFYSQTLQASGGQTPYSWAIADYSALPSNLALATNGVLSGTLSDTADTYYFDVIVTDAAANSSTQTLSLTIVNPPLPPLVITNASLPNGNVGAAYSAHLGATGGQSPYFWSYALGSQNLSLIGLSLDSSGLISGTPTTNRVFSFKVQVTDSSVSDPPTNKVLSITINSKPVLSSPAWLANQFQMRLTGASNQNYTVQVSTNLSTINWIPILTNNAPTNSFIVVDPNATNKQRFYRVLIGP